MLSKLSRRFIPSTYLRLSARLAPPALPRVHTASQVRTLAHNQTATESTSDFTQKIISWISHYRSFSPQQIIKRLEDIKNDHEWSYRLSKNAEYQALQYCLPGTFSEVSSCTRGIIAAEIADVAMKLHLPHHQICLPHESSSLAVSRADNVSFITNLTKPEEYIAQIKSHREKKDQVVKLIEQKNVLDPDRIKRAKTQAAHLGYGGISEDPDAARELSKIGIILCPEEEPMKRVGNKILAAKAAEDAKLPLLRTYNGPQDINSLLKAVSSVGGFPVMWKGEVSGGGKNIFLARNAGELNGHAPSMKGNSYLQEYVPAQDKLHLEIQVFKDRFGTVVVVPALRDCTPQDFRNQKRFHIGISMSEAIKYYPHAQRMANHSKTLFSKQDEYIGPATVEWLFNKATKKFFFLEVNPRLQFEKTVTEGLMGDLVNFIEWQFFLAGSQMVLLNGVPNHVPGPPSHENYLGAKLKSLGMSPKGLSAQQMLDQLVESCRYKWAFEYRLNAGESTVHSGYGHIPKGTFMDGNAAGTIESIYLPDLGPRFSYKTCVQAGTHVDTLKTNATLVQGRVLSETYSPACWDDLLTSLRGIEITGNVPTNQEYLEEEISVYKFLRPGQIVAGHRAEVDRRYVDRMEIRERDKALISRYGTDEQSRHKTGIFYQSNSQPINAKAVDSARVMPYGIDEEDRTARRIFSA